MGDVVNKNMSHYFAGTCAFGGLELFDSIFHLGTFCEDGTYSLPVDNTLHLSSNILVALVYGIPAYTYTFATITVAQSHIKGIINACDRWQQQQTMPGKGMSHQQSGYLEQADNILFILGDWKHPFVVFTWFNTYKDFQLCTITPKTLTFLGNYISLTYLDILPIRSKGIEVDSVCKKPRTAIERICLSDPHKVTIATTEQKSYAIRGCKLHHKLVSHKVNVLVRKCYYCCDSVISLTVQPFNMTCTNPSFVPIMPSWNHYTVDGICGKVKMALHQTLLWKTVASAEGHVIQRLRITIVNAHDKSWIMRFKLPYYVSMSIRMSRNNTPYHFCASGPFFLAQPISISRINNNEEKYFTFLFEKSEEYVVQHGMYLQFYGLKCLPSHELQLQVVDHLIVKCYLEILPVTMQTPSTSIHNFNRNTQMYTEPNIIINDYYVLGPFHMSYNLAVHQCEKYGWRIMNILPKSSWLHFAHTLTKASWQANILYIDRLILLSTMLIMVVEADINSLNPSNDSCQAVKDIMTLHALYSYKDSALYMKDLLPGDILGLNYDLYCTNKRAQDINVTSNLCTVGLSLSCWAVILLIPCDLMLPYSMVICQHQHTKLPPINKTVDNVTTVQCPDDKNYFQCKDKSCIVIHHVCDGKEDCPGGSDELGCAPVCSIHAQEIPASNWCYALCQATNCSCTAMYFQCEHTGGCVPLSKICDCYKD